MKTLFHRDLTPSHSFVNVRLSGTQNSYTYIFDKPCAVGDEVEVDARGKVVTGIITAIDQPIPTTCKYAFKCVLCFTADSPACAAYQFSAAQPIPESDNEREPDPDYDYQLYRDNQAIKDIEERDDTLEAKHESEQEDKHLNL